MTKLTRRPSRILIGRHRFHLAKHDGGGLPEAERTAPAFSFSVPYRTAQPLNPDSWTISSVAGTGTNGNSVLTFLHSGTAGTSAISIPNLNVTSSTNFGLLIGGGSTGLIHSIGSLGLAGQLLTSNGPGVDPSFQPPATVTTATLTLTTAKLLELNAVDTLVSVGTASGGSTMYTGTFSHCATPNALVGAWYIVAGFSTSANNGTFGPVSACTSTTITLPNGSGAAETDSATATNFGFQIVGAQGSGTIIVPETAVLPLHLRRNTCHARQLRQRLRLSNELLNVLEYELLGDR